MTVYAVAFGPPRARRYLACADSPGVRAKGWRSLVWTLDVGRAEKFSTPEGAAREAASACGHDRFTVVPIFPRPVSVTGGPGALA